MMFASKNPSQKPPLPGQAQQTPTTSQPQRPPLPSSPTVHHTPPPLVRPPVPKRGTDTPSDTAILQEALPLIKRFEGCRLEAYLCPAGVPTIGWGSTKRFGKPVVMGSRITQKEADDLLVAQTTGFLQGLKPLITVPLSAKQYAALLSFTYNVGLGAFTSATMRQHIQGGKYLEAAQQFDRWIFANGKVLQGLVKRRQAEKALFLAGTPS
jgi:lysozyme